MENPKLDADEWQAPREEWTGQQITVSLPSGERVEATYLAFWSSEQSAHEHAATYVPEGLHCQACRWFEMALFRVDSGYVLTRHNISTLPDEQDRLRVTRVDEPADLVMMLGHRHRPLLSLLEMAALFDRRCEDLVVGRRT